MNCLKVFSSCLCCDFKSTVMAVDRTERGLNGMDIVKVSIMGICGMMLGFILKETRPEFAALVTMMTGFLILGLAAGKVSYLFETMNRLRESFPIDSSYLTVPAYSEPSQTVYRTGRSVFRSSDIRHLCRLQMKTVRYM